MKNPRSVSKANRGLLRFRLAGAVILISAAAAMAFVAARPSSAAAPKYDINTLAGKVASLRGTAGLQIRFSAFLEQEAEEPEGIPTLPTAITPIHVLSSSLDGTTIVAPNVLVNRDTAAAPQNETAIAVDPNNPSRVVGGANDYVTRTWGCTVNGTPCSALGDGYSGTYYSNNGGQTWCCNSNPNSDYTPTTDPSQIGTLIPGIERLVGGQYDAGGDPSVAFDSQGHVFYAGLGFNRTSPPNTVAVNKGTFDGSGNLTWGPPTFINQTTSPSTLNDKEWIAVDSHPGSPFQDRIYVTWTRFLFNAHNGSYVQSPIFFAYSTDQGATFSTPKSIAGNVLYGQGSRPVVGPDGTLYVFWNGSTRLASLNSTYMVKSSDGGATWSPPLSVATVTNIPGVRSTVFRVNSYPAAAAAPNGDVYVTWKTRPPSTVATRAARTIFQEITSRIVTRSLSLARRQMAERHGAIRRPSSSPVPGPPMAIRSRSQYRTQTRTGVRPLTAAMAQRLTPHRRLVRSRTCFRPQRLPQMATFISALTEALWFRRGRRALPGRLRPLVA
jgi:hypothetical protein